MPRILDGNRVRDDIKSELKPRIDALAARGRPPGLAVVLAGHNPASEIYVRNKMKACQDLGIYSETLTPAENIATEELLALVQLDGLGKRYPSQLSGGQRQRVVDHVVIVLGREKRP